MVLQVGEMVPAWMRRLPVFPLLFTYIFVTSAGVVAVILVVLSVVLWPFAKNTYRWISSALAYSVLSQFAWICYDWSGIKVRMFGTAEAYEKLGKEFALMTLSHRGDLDWVAGYVVSTQFDFIHRVRTLPKGSVQFVPGYGQILWALECPFLSRNFAKDEDTIRNTCEVYRNYPFPIVVAIFCEGTRFTQAKYLEGVQYAKDKGLPVLKHHLVPRTKGFSVLAHHLQTTGNFSALYDTGFAYPGITHTPNLMDLLFGRSMTILFYTRRIPMEEVPKSKEELVDYCYKLYQHKDEAYDYFTKHGTYPGPEYHQPFASWVLWKMRLNILFWGLLLFVLPCLLILLYFSWAYIIVLSLLALLFNGLLMVALLIYAYQPMGTSTPQKKTD